MGHSTKSKGRYIYAVIPKTTSCNFQCDGIDDQRIFIVSRGMVAAVASKISVAQIRPERRNLVAHQKVLRYLMEFNTPLPIAFGNIAESDNEIANFISQNQDVLLEQLLRVSGKVEMGVRVKWDVPNIFEHFVNKHPDLREMRDRLFGRNREPTPDEKIEVGRVFDRILEAVRDAHTETVENILSAKCFEIKRSLLRSERDVMNLACLIGRGSQSDFESQIFKAAGNFDNTFTFDFNGPWAPHHFVEIEFSS